MKIGSLSFVLFVLTTAALAQSATPTTPKTTPAPQKSSASPSKPASTAGPTAPDSKSTAPAQKTTVAADAPVITINGLCPAGQTEPTCTKTISRAEFESMVNALAPDMPAQARSRFANEYVQALTVANEGEKLGVDKDPSFDEQLKLARIQSLARGAVRKIQENAKPTQQEVGAFYKENSDRYEEISLRRIYVPKPTAADAKPDAAKAMADKIRERAVAGEDPDKLEAEAYATLKALGTPPKTDLGPKRHGAIDPRYEKQISALNAGQVSEVLDDPQGYSVYKVESKRTIPLETVQKEIESSLLQQRFQERMKQLLGSVKTDLNENYFGPSEPSPRPSSNAPSLQRRPVTPPKQ